LSRILKGSLSVTQTNRRSITSLATVFSLSLSIAAGADSAPELKAQNVVASLSNQTTSIVTVYDIHFDLKLTNKSDKPIRIPKAVRTSGVTTVFVSAIERQQTEDNWTFLNQSSFYGTSSTKYADCSLLAPGESAEIQLANYGLPLLKERARELGKEPTLRASVTLFCKATGGVLNTSGTTVPFQLHLPAEDQSESGNPGQRPLPRQ